MSQRTMTLQEALEMMAEAFNTPVESLSPETPRDSIQGWDSMGSLSLLAELDDRLGLELQADVLREMKRVQHVLDFLAANGALAP